MESRQLSDVDLLELARSGDAGSFAILWERHRKAGLRAAAGITRDHDPEDLLQEASVRILSAIRGGAGPRETFRPYLYAVLRSISMKWKSPFAPMAQIEALSEAQQPSYNFEGQLLDGSITARAFGALRPEWQTVLWYVEVEGMNPREVAPLLGMSPNAISALAYRAREGFRAAWLQAHVNEEAVNKDCRWAAERLGRYRRNRLGSREHERVEEHLGTCLKCTALLSEVEEAAASLGAALLPIFLGPSSLAVFGGGSTVDPTNSLSHANMTQRSVLGLSKAHAGVAAAVLSAVGALVGGAALLALGNGSSTSELPSTRSEELRDENGIDDAVTVPQGSANKPGYSSDEGMAAKDETEESAESPLSLPELKPQAPEAGSASKPANPYAGGESPSSTHPAKSTGSIGIEKPAPTVTPKPTPTPAPVEGLAPPTIGSVIPMGLLLPEVVGTGVPGAVVYVLGNSLPAAEAVVDKEGKWSIIPDVIPNSEGMVEYEAYQTLEGQTSSRSERSSGVTLPTPEFLSIIETGATRHVTFKGPAGSTVEAILNGQPTGNHHQMNGAPTSREIPPLPAGTHTITLRFTEPSSGRYGAGISRTFIVG